ncbi:SDR family NAD(P)-dependent oxidoreductase [Paenibacillus roseipurpureus]|uniref:SDR family NAD(P)-dependent oxidoreductase n=1 Tax=Paenibacillus roseopurpureus TaxID=2918901 RepID=A0AA96LRU4_9BACL|nr:SDR family NAD(P)-dependent oxidoreductase [Paenibacillus sp. MBLB1832]WNR45401.1 SDR family NAD(P)-dependent oxidoreductase [Paenibacillus sp. MBLB1832]
MNRMAVVTGGTDGIGREMIAVLLKEGFSVVFVGRTAEKGRLVIEKLGANSEKLIFLQGDLSLMREVERVANEVKKLAVDGIQLLVHSAGVNLRKRQMTMEGIESTWAIDYLSRFYLTTLLAEKLIQGQPARVITIAASSTRKGRIDFNDLEGPMTIGGLKGLGQAQYANDVFIVELARRFEGQEINCFALNPGAVETQIRRDFPAWLTRVMGLLFRSSVLSAKAGAEAPLYLALSEELTDLKVGLFHRREKLRISSDRSDVSLGTRLWTTSQEFVHKAKERLSHDNIN